MQQKKKKGGGKSKEKVLCRTTEFKLAPELHCGGVRRGGHRSRDAVGGHRKALTWYWPNRENEV